MAKVWSEMRDQRKRMFPSERKKSAKEEEII